MNEFQMRTDKIPFLKSQRLVYQVWNRSFLQFKRSWLISLLWIVIEPLFILGSIGYGLGGFVAPIEGLPYISFFYPALICSSAMFITYFTSTYDNFSKLTFQKLFLGQITTPIEPQEIVIGEVLWGATKGTLSAIGVSIVAGGLGLIETWRIFPALLVIAISCLVFASLGLLITTFINNFDQIIYPSSGFIIPMSLFSGTYFPLTSLPVPLRVVAEIFPLTHSVVVVRGLLTTGFDVWMLAHLAYLLLLAYVLTSWSVFRLSRRVLS